MIENLDGIYETVCFKNNLKTRISYLDTYENFPSHWHIPVEILRCRKNWYKIQTPEEEYTLYPGDIAIIRPGTIHALYAPEEGERTVYLADMTVSYDMSIGTLVSLLPPITIIGKKYDNILYTKVSEILSAIEAEYDNEEPFFQAEIYAMLLKMFTTIGRHKYKNRNVEKSSINIGKYRDRLIKVCNYINDNYMENITLEEAAKIAGFSKFHFTRLFKEFAHMGFYQYLSSKRIASAEQMLSNPDYSITEVAMKSGFLSLGSFNRMFKKIKGCTPTEFREMCLF